MSSRGCAASAIPWLRGGGRGHDDRQRPRRRQRRPRPGAPWRWASRHWPWRFCWWDPRRLPVGIFVAGFVMALVNSFIMPSIQSWLVAGRGLRPADGRVP
ncbi:hypothetical protein QJS66_14535 [Kocuria rhizophila]|nr:hypothetical protein QJS66_14535 [Kocuria rhizophila]